MASPAADSTTGTPRIVYATFPTMRRSGGVHVMIQHVRLLRAAGYSSWLWLPGPGGAPDWFDDDLPLLFGPELALDAGDLVVLPEVPAVPGRDPAPGARKVIFNQNHFYTYAAVDPMSATDPAEPVYAGWSPEPGVWTVSKEGVEILGAVLPQLDVQLVPNYVDTEFFAPRNAAVPSIVWFSRKRPREASLFHRLLATDPRLSGVELHEVTDECWTTVAELFATASVFVAFGHTEGFGLPVAEALAAGCLIAGYDGGGGHELFEAPGAWRVPEQRPLLLRECVVDLVQRREELRPLGPANRSWLMERYGAHRTRDALVGAVQTALAGPGGASTAAHPAGSLDALPPFFHLTG